MSEVEVTTGPVVLAAGAVVWRERAGDVRVAVVHRPRYDDWSLPKGKVDPGEHVLETALREIAEETGAEVVLGRPLGATSYLALGRPKRVHYWAARALGGDFTPHAEIDALEWLPVEAAREWVDRESDRAVLAQFARGPLRTTPVIVLRHAKAVARKAWTGPDRDRPLAPAGEAQARRLSGLVRAWRPERVVSSPTARCLQTVRPMLDDREAELVEGLSETGHRADPELARKVLERLVTEGGCPALVCSHRPVLPDLVDTVRGLADVPLDLDLNGTPLRTAEMLIAHVAGGRVVAAERQRP